MPLFAGRLLLGDSAVEGWLEADGGKVLDWGEGASPRKPDGKGWICPAPVNAHTHAADAFLRDLPGKPDTVADLVGPGGWKHRNLAHAQADAMRTGIERYVAEMAALGTSRFIDFREGGLGGVVFLRSLAEDLPVQPIIMGRPASNTTFDDNEAFRLVQDADGIGLSALRDFERRGDAEAWADLCHKHRKPFALHASEAKHEDIHAVLALEPDFIVHCTQATKADLHAIADQGASIVVCPRSNAHYGMKTPLDAMLAAGCSVAVGTDNGMLNDGNLLAELALLHGWFPKVTVEALLRMATWNGRALAHLPPPLPPKKGRAMELVVLPDVPFQASGAGKPGFTGFTVPA